MKKIGITGQNGFVGYHLTQQLSLQPSAFEIIPFERSYFNEQTQLDEFVQSCDVIVHLAALNRHNDPDQIYSVNTGLVHKLTESLVRTGAKPHVLISSSTQEERDNLYGKSKKEARQQLAHWAQSSGAHFTGMVIPNVFGPFGEPYYNSVIATFCHQISRNEMPKIDVDGQLKLIYVGELVEEMIHRINIHDNSHQLEIAHTAEAKVSEIFELLQKFQKVYQEEGNIPKINSDFEHKLFNTYRCYMDLGTYFPKKYVQHTDPRGAFVELARLGISGQMSFSTTVPGITRGNHFHTRKIERFSVIQGKALIELRRIGTAEVLSFELDGEEPAYVDMPIWYTHNIKNVGESELLTIFWINEPYDPADPDTYFVEV
jgi:UDP-2-acetamido-2,6-beta-L-arabino-hexul-4-ose reductase